MKHIVGKVLTLIIPLFFTPMLSCYHPSWAEGELTHPSSEVTHRTLRRHYILSRIATHVDTLQKAFFLSPTLPEQFYHDVSLIQLNNSLLQSAEQEIGRQGNLTPFFQLFYKYSNYKFIEDETIDDELLKLVDHITNFFLESSTTNENLKEKLLLTNFDRSELIRADDTEIIFRFYFQKRVECAVHHIVENIDATRSIKNLFANFSFRHEKINKSVESIKISNNIKSYVELYKELQNYYYLDNFSLQHEFLLLTSLLFESLQKKPTNEDFYFLKKKSIRKLLDHLNSLEHGSNVISVDPDLDINSVSYPDYDRIALKDIIASEFKSSEIEFNKRVLRRYYFLKRLSFMDDFPSIKISSEESTLKIRPLIYDWKKFKRYMLLSDQLLIDDFAQEIFLVADPNANNADSAPLNDTFIAKKELISSWADIESFIDIDSIVLRFYIIKRLENSMKKMALFQDLSLVFKEEELVHFSHPIVLDFITKIQLSTSIAPLLLLSEDVEAYFYIGDEQFLKEYLMLLTLSETNLFESFSASHRDSKKKNLKT